MSAPFRHVVAIGGGHGLARTLRAARLVSERTTAIVTVADDGGSSGRLRRDLDVPAPGDLRMALAALARDADLAMLLQYRFDAGELEGHSLGNLVLVAARDLLGGDLTAALAQVGELLDVPGAVLPCTPDTVELHAETEAGPISGQVAIAQTAPVRRVWLEPERPRATPQAIAAVADADLVVLGPGSIFTSILPNLLVPDLGDAVVRADAPVVLVANLREQLHESRGMTLADHLDALVRHVPGLKIETVVAHDGSRHPSGEGAPLDVSALASRNGAPTTITADVLDDDDGHDPEALAALLAQVRARAPEHR